MPEYARACQSMPEYARVYQSMPEYARNQKHRVKHRTFCLTMRCFSDVLKKNIDLNVLKEDMTMFEEEKQNIAYKRRI